jgi:UDP-N-acetylmuramate dehydrogenase
VHLDSASVITRPAVECGFVYRGSALPSDEVVVEADLALRPRPRAEIQADVRALRRRRDEREPKKVSNAGSIFKNPPGDYAGRLIEACSLKGTRIGGAECSPVHANWLVNTGSATAADMLALIELVQSRVREVHGVSLELEIKILGED